MNITHCLNWADLPATATPAGGARRVVEGAGATLVMLRISAGTQADRHSHSHEQFVQVVAGAGRLVTEQGERAFTAGSVFHFPAGTWHQASFDTDTVLIETNLYPSAGSGR